MYAAPGQARELRLDRRVDLAQRAGEVTEQIGRRLIRPIGIEVEAIECQVGRDLRPRPRIDRDRAGHAGGVDAQLDLAEAPRVAAQRQLARQGECVEPADLDRVRLERSQRTAQILGHGGQLAAQLRIRAGALELAREPDFGLAGQRDPGIADGRSAIAAELQGRTHALQRHALVVERAHRQIDLAAHRRGQGKEGRKPLAHRIGGQIGRKRELPCVGRKVDLRHGGQDHPQPAVQLGSVEVERDAGQLEPIVLEPDPPGCPERRRQPGRHRQDLLAERGAQRADGRTRIGARDGQLAAQPRRIGAPPDHPAERRRARAGIAEALGAQLESQRARPLRRGAAEPGVHAQRLAVQRQRAGNHDGAARVRGRQLQVHLIEPAGAAIGKLRQRRPAVDHADPAWRLG